MSEILEKFLVTKFEKELYGEAYKNLECFDSKIRHCNFAYALRALLENIFQDRISVAADVAKSTWYVKDSTNPNPVTRVQRYKYALQGSIDDYFVEEILHFTDVKLVVEDLNEKNRDLSKYAHIKEKFLDYTSADIQEFVADVEQTIECFIDEFSNIQQELFSCLKIWLDDAINNHFMSKTIEEVDYLSTHYFMECVTVENIDIIEKRTSNIFWQLEDGFNIKVEGIIDIEHQYGSCGDHERGDGCSLNSNFPYEVTLFVKIPRIKDIVNDDEEYTRLKTYNEEEKQKLNEEFFKEFYHCIEVIESKVDESSFFE